jgi:hypothetical protein
MPPPAENPLRFVVAQALRKALKLVRGLRKQIDERDEQVMAAKLIDEIGIAGYEIVRKQGNSRFTFEPPTGQNEELVPPPASNLLCH